MSDQDSSDDSMTAVVEFQIRPENNSMREWLDVWSIRGTDAQQGEPETNAYATAVNLDEPNNVVVFERYANGARSVAAHMQRQAHANLMQAMGERNMTKRQVMSTVFSDLPDFGFWSRADALPTNQSRLTLLGLRFINSDMQARWLEMVGEHTAYCREQETPTLIYSAGLANRDAEKEIGVKTGDLIVAMLSADEAGISEHQNDKRHLQLQAAFASEGIQRDLLFARRYQVTGDGYWWR
jgi:quinol monooxygenase YgiN